MSSIPGAIHAAVGRRTVCHLEHGTDLVRLPFSLSNLRLLLPEQPAWKRFVLLLLLSSFWEVRCGPAARLALGRFCEAGTGYKIACSQLLVGVGGGVLCAFAFLIAGDTGVYATAAWFMVLLADCCGDSQQKPRYRIFTALAAFVATGFVGRHIAINCSDGHAPRLQVLARVPGADSALSLGHAGGHDGTGRSPPGSAPVAWDERFSCSRVQTAPDTLLASTQRTGFLFGGFVLRFGHAAERAGPLRHRTRDHRRIGHGVPGQRNPRSRLRGRASVGGCAWSSSRFPCSSRVPFFDRRV